MTFKLTTPDPAFDPNQPLMVNGYLFVPADGARVQHKPRRPVLKDERARKVVAHGR